MRDHEPVTAYLCGNHLQLIYISIPAPRLIFDKVPVSVLGEAGLADKRILLVEDEPAISEILALALRAEGYQVDQAINVAEAMACLGRNSYALVITDWRLPDGDGLLIADTAVEQGSKTFVMSGYLFQMPGGRALEHEILMKPLRPSEVVAAVERSIGKARVC